MQQVLWLTSWYPNKFDFYNGDFIQRHAKAVAPYCKLTVIHVQMVPSNFQKENETVELIENEHFYETIIYVRTSNLPYLLNKIANQIRYDFYFKKAIKQYLNTQGKPSLVHVHVPIKAGKLALWLKFKFCIPYLLTEHYAIYNNYAKDKYTNRNLWFKYFTKKVIKEASLFLPVSKNLGETINQLVISKKYHVVFNVVDTTIFNFKPILDDTHFWFVHVSTMNDAKNTEGILRAFAMAYRQNNNLRLRLIGPVNTTLVQLANNLNIAAIVIFTGMLQPSEVAFWLQQSHAFILFSNYENMPCVIAEALCCGLPIISTNVGGISEIVCHQNGRLILAKDELALTSAMLAFATKSTNFSHDLISEKAKNMFAFETIGKQIINAYKSVTAI